MLAGGTNGGGTPSASAGNPEGPLDADVQHGGCALLSLLACQSSCAPYANEMSPSVPMSQMSALMPAEPEAARWILEKRGLADTPPWNQLPRIVRPKAKLPSFLRAGWDILEIIRTEGLDEFGWMLQDHHGVPSATCPHTYVYTHDAGRSGRKRPLLNSGLTITTEGGGHFWTENGQSGAAAPGTEGVFACSARDAQGELLLGKCFRRARLLRHVADRSVKKADVEYLDNYSLLHLGVRELTEQRAFVNQQRTTEAVMPLGNFSPGFGLPLQSPLHTEALRVERGVRLLSHAGLGGAGAAPQAVAPPVRRTATSVCASPGGDGGGGHSALGRGTTGAPMAIPAAATSAASAASAVASSVPTSVTHNVTSAATDALWQTRVGGVGYTAPNGVPGMFPLDIGIKEGQQQLGLFPDAAAAAQAQMAAAAAVVAAAGAGACISGYADAASSAARAMPAFMAAAAAQGSALSAVSAAAACTRSAVNAIADGEAPSSELGEAIGTLERALSELRQLVSQGRGAATLTNPEAGASGRGRAID
jgi:hypothetical protein